MKRLIDGQTIKIDNHNTGTKLEWGKSIHLHKRMNNDKYSGAEVLIYIGDDRELEFRKVTGGEQKEERLRNEIKDAFKNNTIKDNFIKSFYESLNDYLNACGKTNENEKNELYIQAATRIVKSLGLKAKVKESFMKEANSFVSFEFEDSSDTIVAFNPQDESTVVGHNKEIVEEMLDSNWSLKNNEP